jgi:hypothetical protein
MAGLDGAFAQLVYDALETHKLSILLLHSIFNSTLRLVFTLYSSSYFLLDRKICHLHLH